MNLSIFLSTMAMVISAVAIVLTIVQIKMQREHNFRSIKPIGAIDVGNYETDVFVAISNAGIGPLIIETVKIYNRNRTATNLIDVLPDNLAQELLWSDFVTQLEGRAVQVGEKIYLIRAIFPDESPELTQELIDFREDLRDCLAEITVEFTYIDIYEKNTYEVKRVLDFFED